MITHFSLLHKYVVWRCWHCKRLHSGELFKLPESQEAFYKIVNTKRFSCHFCGKKSNFEQAFIDSTSNAKECYEAVSQMKAKSQDSNIYK